MRILLLTHYYEPEIGAPQRRWRGLVREFVDRGHSVAVCTPVAHYPHRRADDLSVAQEKIWKWDDGQRGERILRVPYAPTSGSMPGQLIDQSISSVASVVAAAAMKRMKPEVIISTTPGLPMPFAAAAVSKVLRVPHIAEIRDAWPDLISDTALVRRAAQGRVPEAVAELAEARVLPGAFHGALRTADALVTTTESFADRLRGRNLPPVTVVRNTSEVTGREPRSGNRPPGSDLHMLYVGTVGRSQGLDTVVRAVADVEGVRLRIVGVGAQLDELRNLAAGLTERVEFFPQTTGAALEAHWGWAHTGLVSLADVPAFELTVPSKLVSIMARGVHVTGVVAGEAAQMLRDAAGGAISRPGDIDGLRNLLITLRESRESTATDGRPFEWLRNHASPESAADTYEDLLEKVSR